MPCSVTPGSRLEQALGALVDGSHTCRVNSRHHQSVGRVGSGLVPSATAPDGVVEAIEKPDGEFCVGVQWHPENFWRTGEFAPLFDTFVERRAGASERAEWFADAAGRSQLNGSRDVRRVGFATWQPVRASRCHRYFVRSVTVA